MENGMPSALLHHQAGALFRNLDIRAGAILPEIVRDPLEIPSRRGFRTAVADEQGGQGQVGDPSLRERAGRQKRLGGHWEPLIEDAIPETVEDVFALVLLNRLQGMGAVSNEKVGARVDADPGETFLEGSGLVPIFHAPMIGYDDDIGLFARGCDAGSDGLRIRGR